MVPMMAPMAIGWSGGMIGVSGVSQVHVKHIVHFFTIVFVQLRSRQGIAQSMSFADFEYSTHVYV